MSGEELIQSEATALIPQTTQSQNVSLAQPAMFAHANIYTYTVAELKYHSHIRLKILRQFNTVAELKYHLHTSENV